MSERDPNGPGAAGREAEEVPVDEGVQSNAADPGRDAEESATAEVDPAEAGQAEVDGDAAGDPLLKAERQRDEYLELARRTKAEFENYRRRMTGEVAEAKARGSAELATGLIDVIDNLERALEAAEIDPLAAANGEAEVEGALEQGVALTYRELCGVMKKAGVEGYSPDGERFDPTWHEALQSLPGTGAESGTVVQVVQKGYRQEDRVLRPARVIVSA